MPSIKVKRGTRAQIDAAAAASKLSSGEIYLITDEKRLAVGISPNSYSRFALESVAVVSTTATQQSTSTTLANINQLVLPVEANSVYEIDAFITFQSAATTTGLGLGVLTPALSINLIEIVIPVTSTAAASQLRTIFPNAAVATNDTSIVGTGVTAINSNHTARISGLIKTNSNKGNCQLQFRSEISDSAVTLQIGSIMTLKKIG